jgi:hypothetical protein
MKQPFFKSLLLGRSSCLLRRSCAGGNTMYSRAKRVFILENYFASKSSAAGREAFANSCPDTEVRSKKTAHRLVTKFRETGSVCGSKDVLLLAVLTGGTVSIVKEALKHALFCYIGVTEVHECCCSQGCVLNGTR